MEALIAQSPSANDIQVLSFPDGWPADGKALTRAASLALYYDGAQGSPDEQPLANEAHRTVFEKLMRQGVGVIALHQASTVGVDDRAIDLPRWLGGARYGTFDRTTETVRFQPTFHPVTTGVKTFELTDEFYPTIRFSESLHTTSLLIGKLHPQFREGKELVVEKSETHPVAWAVERVDHGRAVTFTGLHFLTGFDVPAIRTMFLNAVVWTARP